MALAVGPSGPVHEFALDNGLRVLLAPQPKAGTASIWVWYRVGSKNEWPGVTGASHWVEHMMFNGSPKFPKGSLDRAILETGGYLNAFTDVDFTAYLSTVPAEHADIPLAIEADRMTRAHMTPEEVERERAIVLSEREGNENWPEFRAEEELYASAFRRHPYRWDPLGYPEDIRGMQADKLADYYRRFYGTRNATLVVVGRFDAAQTSARVRELFAPLPAGGDDPVVTAREAPPTGERRSLLRGPGTTPFVLVGYPAPAVVDPLTPATVLLDVLLGGETRLFSGATWGRSGEHPSARLYRALVDKGIAVRATSEWRPREHPGLFGVHAQAAAGVPIERVEAAVFAELERLAAQGPEAQELREAREKVAQSARLAYEGATRTAFRLGFFAMLGNRAFESQLLRCILTVPASAIRTQAQQIFRPEARVIVRYEPEAGPHAAA